MKGTKVWLFNSEWSTKNSLNKHLDKRLVTTPLLIGEWRQGNWETVLSMCPVVWSRGWVGAPDGLSEAVERYSCRWPWVQDSRSLDRQAQTGLSWVLPRRVSRSSWRWSGWILATSSLTGVVTGRTRMIWTSAAQCFCSGLTVFISFSLLCHTFINDEM